MSRGETRLWWLRHAPVPDPRGRILGQRDLACDTSDEDWFKAIAARLPQRPVVVDSGLLRTRQTLAALEREGSVLAPSISEPAFAEQDFGQWTGHGWDELASAKDPDLAAFWADPAGAEPPGGESFAAVVRRVEAGMTRLVATHGERDILICAHAGSIRAALAVALGIDPAKALSFVVEPLSLTRLDHLEQGAWRIGQVNWLPS